MIAVAPPHRPEARAKANRSNRGRKFKCEPTSIEKFVANGTMIRGEGRRADELRRAQRLSPAPYAKLDRCPRCGGPLQEEPIQYYCRFGCARFFPKLVGSLTAQYEYEVSSGLV